MLCFDVCHSDVGCKTVANMIKGKTPEEIRKLFNIVNDFTPEEEVRPGPVVSNLLSSQQPLLPRLKSRKKTYVLLLLCMELALMRCLLLLSRNGQRTDERVLRVATPFVSTCLA